ncbi:MAG: AI-2E family transporter [Candidatus Competibacteraceae bacterium]
MTSNRAFSAPARGLLVAGAFALVVTILQSAASILVPILLAVFIAIVTTPMLHWMRGRGVPKWGALMAIAFVLLDVGSLLALVTTGAVEGFRDRLPTYQERFMTFSHQFGGWLEGVGAGGSSEAIPDLMNPDMLAHGVRLFLSNASGIFAMGFLVLLATIFILLEAPTIPAKLRAAFHLTEEGDARLQRLLDTVNRYMQIKTLTSLGTAACAWLLLRFFGIDFAILWAVLAFFLNFVPVVGNIVMMIPPVLLALIQIDPWTALLVAIGYLVINTVIGNVLEPRIMGKGLGVSTLAIFISLLFWGWLFGTVGMFLAVPLTAAVVIALDANPHTRPLAILLGPEIAEAAAPEADSPWVRVHRGFLGDLLIRARITLSEWFKSGLKFLKSIGYLETLRASWPRSTTTRDQPTVTNEKMKPPPSLE